ncbi:unnamed protein product [Ilex paraguariensis]|uniref:Uncharacterized protein n=1 Tax=Ilex paraguariensis TaxID=185542 RepID=A0ABC8TWR5_9AQUA
MKEKKALQACKRTLLCWVHHPSVEVERILTIRKLAHWLQRRQRLTSNNCKVSTLHLKGVNIDAKEGKWEPLSRLSSLATLIFSICVPRSGCASVHVCMGLLFGNHFVNVMYIL